MVKKRSIKKSKIVVRQRAVSATIAMVLISIFATGILAGLPAVAGEREEPPPPVKPGVDVTPPDILLISVMQYDSQELADSNTKGIVLNPKNAPAEGIGGNYETRPGKVVRITISVSDYGKGFATEDVVFWVGSTSSIMEQEAGSVFHFDFQRDQTGTYGINVVATDYEDNEGKLWIKYGKIEVREAPTSPSKKKGRGTKEEQIDVDPVRYQYYEVGGDFFTTDGNKAIRNKGRRGNGESPSAGDISDDNYRGQGWSYGFVYLRYIDKRWYDKDGDYVRTERIYWWDGEGKSKNVDALDKAEARYDDNKDGYDKGKQPQKKNAEQAQREIDERSQRDYGYWFYTTAEFTLYNINKW